MTLNMHREVVVIKKSYFNNVSLKSFKTRNSRYNKGELHL